LFDLGVFDQLIGLEELDGLVKLIDLESDAILLGIDQFSVLHNLGEHFDVLKIFLTVFCVDVSLEITEAAGETLKLSVDVLLHEGAGHGVVFGITSFNEDRLVRGTSERLHHLLVVEEANMDFDLTGLVYLVRDGVLSVISVLDLRVNDISHDLGLVLLDAIWIILLSFFRWNFFLNLVLSLDLDLEDIMKEYINTQLEGLTSGLGDFKANINTKDGKKDLKDVKVLTKVMENTKLVDTQKDSITL
jgi:hypothetical protein